MPLDLDSPYQISKVVGEFYSVYYHRQHGLPTVRARFQNVYGPGEILGAGRWRGTPATVWRNVTPTFVYRALKGLPLAARQRRRRDAATSSTSTTSSTDCSRCATRRRAGRRLQPRERRRDDDPPARRADHRAQRSESRSSSARAAVGPLDHALRQHREGEARARLRGGRAPRGSRRTVEWTRENLELIDRCIARHAARMAEVGAPIEASVPI